MADRKLNSNIHAQVLSERAQTHSTRQHLFEEIGDLLGRPLLTFFTSFSYPVAIDDDDGDIIQSVLSEMDLSKGFALLINSPGGDGLAAERIINVCRSYSGTGDFWAIVAGKAKSAATMICMGASKIMMALPSELGPVDPQIIRTENGDRKIFSAHSLVKLYDRLFSGAVKTKGNLQPYVQQLAHFDVRDIAKFRSYMDLADDIAVKSLASGMMKGTSNTNIKKKIRVFLDPAAGTMAHGRPIYLKEAQGTGLKIDPIDVKSDLWKNLYELYVRTDGLVSGDICKVVESKSQSFVVPMNR